MKVPWEKDPNDREANYRKPVPRAEIVRTGSKIVFAAIVGGWLWFVTRDRCEVDQLHDVCGPTANQAGANLVLALGVTTTVLSLIDLFYLRRHDLELIFARSKKQQLGVRLAALAIGLVASGVGATRLL